MRRNDYLLVSSVLRRAREDLLKGREPWPLITRALAMHEHIVDALAHEFAHQSCAFERKQFFDECGLPQRPTYPPKD